MLPLTPLSQDTATGDDISKSPFKLTVSSNVPATVEPAAPTGRVAPAPPNPEAPVTDELGVIPVMAPEGYTADQLYGEMRMASSVSSKGPSIVCAVRADPDKGDRKVQVLPQKQPWAGEVHVCLRDRVTRRIVGPVLIYSVVTAPAANVPFEMEDAPFGYFELAVKASALNTADGFKRPEARMFREGKPEESVECASTAPPCLVFVCC